MGSGTCWIANRQDEHSTEKRISTFSTKENCHINTPFSFCIYVLTSCLPSNTKRWFSCIVDANSPYCWPKTKVITQEWKVTCGIGQSAFNWEIDEEHVLQRFWKQIALVTMLLLTCIYPHYWIIYFMDHRFFLMTPPVLLIWGTWLVCFLDRLSMS